MVIEKDLVGTGYRGIAPILILLLMALAACQESLPDEWSRFRGPNGSGVTESTNLPVRLGPELNVIWKTPLPPGHSSPVLDGQRVFLTAVDGDILTTFCLDRETGEVLWEINLGSPVSGFPISFGVNGRQYVAVGTGAAGTASHFMGLTPELRPSSGNNLFVFALPERE